ncbi:DUF3141 domain-containing protein [Bradyrhizobium sp. I71]|jgi:hypothetical protein|uniref:DUF3141 domain-containing protein n=1 Tax=Bradyrhizobium sp. I71 TaxID=2590772 RepID=UPI001EF81075|nr:DUF3141 domain-containing protein [Bradyrhizobium sp. I71]ULL01597.1 DUF3141 domain-containing protein [Bradyrhizobium sp. I71]
MQASTCTQCVPQEANRDGRADGGFEEARDRLLNPATDHGALWAYGRDFWERSILFWDTLRRRADDLIEHERRGLPPLLDFRFETILDARRFERPVNCVLLRILPGPGSDIGRGSEQKPPILILDPRAGHGPGIGGFKQDSEVGVALSDGNPVYFVSFFPQPCHGQTLADVLHALRRFVEAVAHRHPDRPPILYGNCQAGWAVTLLSADCSGLVGPAVLNGSPLSYWSGEVGINPMRLAAGFNGGAWLVHLVSDLSDGRFDGAWLAQNFENLKPEAQWEKYADLFTHIDRERDRFLEFERWWGSFFFLSREEILAIVENLFIGNQLEGGRFRICEHCFADLRRIRNPLVIFASYGDNITPPHQALGWIPVVYKTTEQLIQAGQRIVYLTNPHVGHLGIFVSAKIAQREHRAILASLSEIEGLPPGLYEMKIEEADSSTGASKLPFAVRFESRRVEELKFQPPDPAFERIRDFSEAAETIYRTFFSPFVQSTSNPLTAEAAKWLHPMRMSRYLLSPSFSPWLRGLPGLAGSIRDTRVPLAEDNPFLAAERTLIGSTTSLIEASRINRDAALERMFEVLYGRASSRGV